MCWRKTPFEASGACHYLTVCYDPMKEGPEKERVGKCRTFGASKSVPLCWQDRCESLSND